MNDHQEAPLVEEGDMALILRRDGTVKTLSFGIDTSGLGKEPEDMSDEDMALLEQGHKLWALTLAANSPAIMEILTQIANDPTILETGAFKAFVRPN